MTKKPNQKQNDSNSESHEHKHVHLGINTIDEKLHFLYLNGDEKLNTVLILHSTGGDEAEMMDLARFIYPNNPIIGIRGRIVEDGDIIRYFKRDLDMNFDIESINQEEVILVNRIEKLIKKFDLNEKIDVIAYSNGANIILNALLKNMIQLENAIAFHPMLIEDIKTEKINSKTKILVTHGKEDPIVSEENFNQLISSLDDAGYLVGKFEVSSGHAIVNEEIIAAKKFLKMKIN